MKSETSGDYIFWCKKAKGTNKNINEKKLFKKIPNEVRKVGAMNITKT